MNPPGRLSGMELPWTIGTVEIYPYDVTPTSLLVSANGNPPAGGMPKFINHGPPLEPPLASEPYSTLFGNVSRMFRESTRCICWQASRLQGYPSFVVWFRERLMVWKP